MYENHIGYHDLPYYQDIYTKPWQNLSLQPLGIHYTVNATRNEITWASAFMQRCSISSEVSDYENCTEINALNIAITTKLSESIFKL